MISEVRGGDLLEATGRDDGCVPGGAVVGVAVGSSRVHRNSRIGLAQRSGGDAAVYFRMPYQTKGMAYSVVGGSGGRGREVCANCE